MLPSDSDAAALAAAAAAGASLAGAAARSRRRALRTQNDVQKHSPRIICGSFIAFYYLICIFFIYIFIQWHAFLRFL